MAELKTRVSTASVAKFLDSIPDAQTRADCKRIAAIMRKETAQPAEMWGTAIVGFGRYHYKYASGREADWMQLAFSPRKGNITLYLTGGLQGHDALLAMLGKHACGKGCLYVKRLSDLHVPTLEKLLAANQKRVRELQRAMR
jgi:hypothetical protein